MADLPPIPEAGLSEVLSGWSGEGALWEALASVEEEGEPHKPLSERKWSATDVRRRANRILLAQLTPLIAQWPGDVGSWIESLPAGSTARREIVRRPLRGTAWAETRRRFGWPPSAYATRTRERTADQFLLTTLRWTLEKLAATRHDAVRLSESADVSVRTELDAAADVLRFEMLEDVEPVQPTISDIAALSRSGSPWNVVTPVADEYLRFATSLPELARALLRPDEEEFAWRLFHLGVFGQVLLALRSVGAALVSRAPLSGGASGPAYEVILPSGDRSDLWFEAAGAWGFYGVDSPYVEAAAGTAAATRALGADVLLIRLHDRALLLECKYSADARTVGRDGYHQASSYALEVRSRLAGEAVAYAVGPAGVVVSTSLTQAFVGLANIRVGVTPPEGIAGAVERFVAE